MCLYLLLSVSAQFFLHTENDRANSFSLSLFFCFLGLTYKKSKIIKYSNYHGGQVNVIEELIISSLLSLSLLAHSFILALLYYLLFYSKKHCYSRSRFAFCKKEIEQRFTSKNERFRCYWRRYFGCDNMPRNQKEKTRCFCCCKH